MEQIMEKRKLRLNKSWKNDMELITEKRKFRWNNSEKN